MTATENKERTTVTEMRQRSAGDRIRTTALVKESTVRETKRGKSFVSLTLSDETGAIDAVAWGHSEAPDVGEVVDVGGKVGAYQGEPQITVDFMQVLVEPSMDGLIPTSRFPGHILLGAVVQMAHRMCDDSLLQTVQTALDSVFDELTRWPAAKGNHHARVGGLIEHINSMLHIAEELVDHYTPRYEATLDIGIICAGIIFHDLGKIYELSGPVGTEYTAEQLVGHIPQGILMLEDARRSSGADLDDHTLRHLRHIILSHHGCKEWGSPVEPMTAEAVLVHQIDMVDSRMDKVLSAASKAEPGDEWVEAGYREKYYVGRPEEVTQ